VSPSTDPHRPTVRIARTPVADDLPARGFVALLLGVLLDQHTTSTKLWIRDRIRSPATVLVELPPRNTGTWAIPRTTTVSD
jgi:hypothetical protein